MLSNGLIQETCGASTPVAADYNVGQIDRYGNVLPTIIISADQTINWKAYDFADAFLSQLTTIPSIEIQNYIHYLTENYISSGLWDFLELIRPYVGGDSNNNGLNLKYPFKNKSAYYGTFIGSPIHDSNGITFNGVSQYEVTWLPSVIFPNANVHMSIYSRTNNIPATVMIDMAFDQSRRNMEILSSATRAINRVDTYIFNPPAPNWNSLGSFTLSSRPGANNTKFVKNGNVILNAGTASESALICRGYLTIAAVIPDASNYLDGNYLSNRNYALATAGFGLTDAQILDKYNIEQAAQTILGRQV